MLIGEIVNKTGLSRDTIRFYEKQGLIKTSVDKGATNNYKVYTEEVLNRLLLIKRIKSFGFTLNETSELLYLIEMNQASCKTVSKQAGDKIAVIDQKIQELQAIKKLVSSLNSECCTPYNDNNCPVLVQLT